MKSKINSIQIFMFVTILSTFETDDLYYFYQKKKMR